MEKEFYYLDEKEQKGPFAIDQLKSVGLKPDTLVWADGFGNWKPVKDVEELKGLLKKTPPPPPIIDNSPNSTIQPIKEAQEDKKVLVVDSNVKFWASFKIYVTALLLIGLAVFTTYFISNNKKQKLKKEIYVKVDNVLDGKTVVLDGTESLTQGELKETGYSRTKTKTKVKNIDDLASLLREWWEPEKLYTIYEATNGGFTIKQLTRQNDDGFDLETYYSGDMGYKKPSGRYVEPEYIDDGRGGKFKMSGGYYSSNYRLSVRQCYTEAYEYFTKDDKKSPGAYTPGKYVDISNFADIRNEYYYMDNIATKKYTSSGIFSSSWESSGIHGANINTEDWAVYYKTYGKHYEITENETAIRKDLFTYLGISVGSILILMLIMLFAKPKYFRNLNLFGKRWKNTSYQEQIFFFEHSFFGSHTFLEIINDKVSKGVLKFTDNGNTINLSYPNKELFYKIDTINQDDLILVSIKDKSNITFKRVGAKETELKVAFTENTLDQEVKQNKQSENEETNQ
jgi:hypothetical protein